MNFVSTRALLLACSVFSLFLSACGGGASDAPDLAAVSGTVTLDGQPLADANVTFISENGPVSTAKTDAQGNYSLGTKGQNDGATVGNHKITVTKVSQIPESNDPTGLQAAEDAGQVIPAKYADMNSSGLTATVEAGQDNVVPIELKSK